MCGGCFGRGAEKMSVFFLGSLFFFYIRKEKDMYAKFIILVFLWGIIRLAAEAQPAGWSLPTPQYLLSTSLIPYPAEVTVG